MLNKLIDILASKKVRSIVLAGLGILGFVSNVLTDKIKDRESEEKTREIAREESLKVVNDALAEHKEDEEES